MTANETGFIEAPGARIYYEVEGSGSPVTLIHAGIAQLRMWDAQVEAWRDRHTLIRYDSRGFGKTVCEDVPYSNRADLALVLDHLDIERSHLVGLSRGAIIALDFTVEHPDRVRSLTWVAGGVRGFEAEDPRLEETWKQMEAAEEAHDWERVVELDMMVWTDGPGQPPDRVDPALRRQMVEWGLANYRAEQPADQAIQPEIIAAEHLSEIRVPTLAIWGTFDEAGVPLSGAKLVAEVRGARSHVFEGVAHMVNLERPAEFNRMVGDFLDEVDATDGGG